MWICTQTGDFVNLAAASDVTIAPVNDTDDYQVMAVMHSDPVVIWRGSERGANLVRDGVGALLAENGLYDRASNSDFRHMQWMRFETVGESNAQTA